MLLSIKRGWWCWHVYYSLGQFDDRKWLASFRKREHAQAFIEALHLGWAASSSNDPVNDIGGCR
jgi:hypothetical protein